jgi:hypothetical protein
VDCFIVSLLVGAAVGFGAYAVASWRVDLGLVSFGLAIAIYLGLSHLTGTDPTGGVVEGQGETLDSEELLTDMLSGYAVECPWLSAICVGVGVAVGLSVAEKGGGRHQ